MSSAATCDGSSECKAQTHMHGCFSDDGTNCDHPSEHERPAVWVFTPDEAGAIYAVLGLARGLLDARIEESDTLGPVSDELQAEARKIIDRGYEMVGAHYD